ncbi:MAG: hypothetical protein KY442_12085, partial [Proteobacteria bacterium]|nr:hypothetical protein [Pseudomonadota bacterium]
GENSDLPNVMRPWFDAPVVTTGTQVLMSTAFDFGELGPLRITSEMSQAEVVTLGARVHEPDLHIPAGPLSLYTASCYLGFATGQGEQVARIESLLRTIADRCRSDTPTEINPAKTLAWTLWNRVPLVVANRANRSTIR